MSLINDALKRASQSDKDQPREAIIIGLPVESVEAAPKASKLPIILTVVAGTMVALGIAGLFISRGLAGKNRPIAASSGPVDHREENKPAPSPAPAPVPDTKVQSPVVPAPIAATKPLVPAPIAAVPLPTSPTPAEPAPTPMPMPPTPQPQAPAAPVANQQAQSEPAPSEALPFPDLRVKAIIYRSKDPLALINSSTVGVGDIVGNARVVKINPKSVILDFHGQAREIPMD